jgi:hypothetical protein
MAFCDPTPWRINIGINGLTERFVFVLNGDGTGRVNNAGGGRMSNLIWSCRPFSAGANQRGLLTFRFRFRRREPSTGTIVEAGATFVGVARVDGAATVISGRVITFSAEEPDVPAGGGDDGLAATLQTDPGDTGTGTGQQT